MASPEVMPGVSGVPSGTREEEWQALTAKLYFDQEHPDAFDPEDIADACHFFGQLLNEDFGDNPTRRLVADDRIDESMILNGLGAALRLGIRMGQAMATPEGVSE